MSERFRPYRFWDGLHGWVWVLARTATRALFSDTPPPDRDRGLYGKYRVEKLNGKPVGQCFVLEEHDPHAMAALRAYAESCRPGYPFLADDLERMANRWHDNHVQAG